MNKMSRKRAIYLLSQMYLPSFDEEEKQALSMAIEVLSNDNNTQMEEMEDYNEY